MFKRFMDDMKKYWKYAVYSSRAQLKSEIANSYLNWLWWILDPLCFMLIYVFMFGYVFKSDEQYFAIFVFIGITMWDFFNRCLLQSVRVIKSNKPIVSKVYIPKFILVIIRMCINGFKMFISFLIVAVMLIVWRVPITWNILYCIPILLTLFMLVFGFGCFLLHYGVFVEDLGIKRFMDDMKKYWKYAVYSSRAQLKSEIANSYLNWLWWILDPLCFMLIYVFMFGYVFKSDEQYFAIFVFIGITMWDFFNRCLLQSVRVIKSNKPIVSKVYIPKFILVIIRMCINGFKMFISFLIVAVMLIVWRVPITWNILYCIPILLTLFMLVFGFGCFLLHYGVFVEDLGNVLNIALRLIFYLTGVFWNIMDRLPAPYNAYIGKGNPIAFLLTSMRECLIYGQTPHRKLLLAWFLIGLVISIIGIRKIYKNENSYVKVI